ncbi:MAG: hypothetical protein JST84_16755 [Acidobacteria bacterium]|nr:hypothetical protein [Acidobacteriota bacterium]
MISIHGYGSPYLKIAGGEPASWLTEHPRGDEKFCWLTGRAAHQVLFVLSRGVGAARTLKVSGKLIFSNEILSPRILPHFKARIEGIFAGELKQVLSFVRS